MATSGDLANQLTQTRNELNNLRKRMQTLRAQHHQDVSRLEELLTHSQAQSKDLVQKASHKSKNVDNAELNLFINWRPIGHIISCFRTKNGTPRQGSVSHLSRGILKVDKSIFNNPQHALEGLQEYSHVWIFFIFNQNEDKGRGHGKTKVAPPRLDGRRVGVFATRSPHRPNPLGLTLARLEKVQDDCVHLSGLDILDGTPVLDIKPYIPQYDAPNIISSTLDITPAQERIDLRKWDKLEYNKTKSVTEINVEENSFSDITVANSSQHSSKPKVVQTEQKIRCSDNEFISEPFSCYDKTNTIVSGSGIVNHQSPKLKDTKVLKLTKELGESSRTINIDGNSGSVDMSNSNCGKNKCLLSQLSKEIKPHLSLGNKHTEIQDLPTSSEQQDTVSDFEKSEEEAGVTTASWLRAPPATPLQVLFNPVAEMQIKLFSQREEQDSYRLEFLGDGAELRATISAVLGEDPRSAYRRQKCSSLLYYFTVDTAHITAWFEGDTAEVLRVHPLQTYKNTSSMET